MPNSTNAEYIRFLLTCLDSKSQLLAPKAIAAICAIGNEAVPELKLFAEKRKARHQRALAYHAISLINDDLGQAEDPRYAVTSAVLAYNSCRQNYLDSLVLQTVKTLGNDAVVQVLREAICERYRPKYGEKIHNVLSAIDAIKPLWPRESPSVNAKA